MASFDIHAHYMEDPDLVVVVPSGTSYSKSFTPTPQAASLGLYCRVEVAGAGTATLTIQTAVASVSDAATAGWVDLDAVAGAFALAANDVSRMRVADFVLDKVRLKVLGSAGGSGSLRVGFGADTIVTVG